MAGQTYSYSQVLAAATVASVALLAVAASILLRTEWCSVRSAVLGVICVLSALTAISCEYVRQQRPCDALSWRGFLTSSAMKLFTATVARYFLWKLRRAYRSRSGLRAAQEATLMRLVGQARDTLFGQDHRFSDIHGIDDYRARVPVRDYADLDKYYQLANKGEPNVFFKGPVDYLAKTSGTTGKNKTFPMSSSFKLSLVLNFMSTARSADEFLAKVGRSSRIAPQLFLAVSPEDKRNKFGIPLGPVTKFFFSRSGLYTTPDEVYFKVHESNTGFYLHAVFALWHETIGTVNVFFPTSLITFMRCLSANWDSVLLDIETGRLSADKLSGVDPELLGRLNQRLSAKPERAAQLRALFGDGRDLTGFFAKAWPNVPFVMLARSGTFHASYRYLRSYLGSVPAHCPCLLGTEGHPGINLSVVGDEEPDRYHPMLAGSFFEFAPVDANGKDLGEPKLAHELQVGGLYETVATSYNCFRLRVGDVVRVVAMDACAPVFEISHRKSHVLTVHVEKTNEKSLQACVLLASERLGCQVVDFSAADCFLYEPVAGVSLGAKYYAMFVELGDDDRRLTESDKLQFDDALRASCENYNLFRGEGNIATMEVIAVKKGAFVALRQEMICLNRDISEVQFKVPRVLRSDSQVKCLLAHRL